MLHNLCCEIQDTSRQVFGDTSPVLGHNDSFDDIMSLYVNSFIDMCHCNVTNDVL